MALLCTVSGADGALVRVGRVVVRADGGFTPQKLPRWTYAPISFKGHVDISSTDSGQVPALREVRLEFDRDGRLATRGLAVCPPARIEGTTPKLARKRCRRALVGVGHVEAAAPAPGGGSLVIRSPLSLFNGPRQHGRPTVVGHARSWYPSPQTYVLQIPIERRHGPYSYRVTFEVPEIAGGLASVTHADLDIKRIFRAGGHRRSYVSARCRDGILETRGRFLFADATVIEGSVFRGCTAIKPKRRRGR